MKLSLNNFLGLIKTKSEASSVFNDVWISRSVIGVKIDEKIRPIFGFGAAFTQEKARDSSVYELLEHLAFSAFAHNKMSLERPVTVISNGKIYGFAPGSVEQYLIGSLGPKGIFSANGTAISTSQDIAIAHSQNELVERHLCCEIWYQRSCPLLVYSKFRIDANPHSTKLKLYTADDILPDRKFIIASLHSSIEGCFILGAAVRSNLSDACEHALCEAVMLFEDIKRKRTVDSLSERSRVNMQSLRNPEDSYKRRLYFESLLDNCIERNSYAPPECETILFEPLPNIYAARSFSSDALDPREFEARKNIPLLPLF